MFLPSILSMTIFNLENLFHKNISLPKNVHLFYRGFHEKGTLSYLCALGKDR